MPTLSLTMNVTMQSPELDEDDRHHIDASDPFIFVAKHFVDVAFSDVKFERFTDDTVVAILKHVRSEILTFMLKSDIDLDAPEIIRD
jgi:hypothetical protein